MKKLLLPYPVKFAGLFLTFAGLLLGVAYLWLGFRFSMPVFAIFSSFLETKTFVTFNTNFADELTMLLLFTGLSLIVFSKEKIESEYLDATRGKAMVKALLYNNILLFFSILFIYGSGFIGMLVINLFSCSLFYLFIFYYMNYKQKTNEKRELSKLADSKP